MNEAQSFSDANMTAGSDVDDVSTGRQTVSGSEYLIGDLFVIAAVADFGVEWLVIEKAADRCLVVPVDMAPMVGSRDLSLTEATGEPMTARGGHSLWLPAHALEQQHRTAELGAEVAAAVSKKLASLMNGAPQHAFDLEVDTESAYVEWDFRLTAARSTLAQQWPVGAEKSPASNSAKSAGRETSVGAATEGKIAAPGYPASRRLVSSLIAAIFALVCVAGWQQFQLRNLTAASTPALTANVPVVALNAEPVRGPRGSIVWPTEAEQLLLLLSFYDPEDHDFYNLELTAETSQDGPWQLDGIERLAFGEITVNLPRALFRDGLYRLDLSGSDPEKPSFVQSFTFEVASE